MFMYRISKLFAHVGRIRTVALAFQSARLGWNHYLAVTTSYGPQQSWKRSV